MIDPKRDIVAKVAALVDYQARLEAEQSADPAAREASKIALAEVIELLKRLLADPNSAMRRLADIQFRIDDLLDEQLELQGDFAAVRGARGAARGNAEAMSAEDTVREIVRVLATAGHLPADIASVPGTQGLEVDQQMVVVRSNDGAVESLAKAESLRERLSTDAEYTIWYGTNRRPVDPNDISKGYTGERGSITHYGSCRVYVPKSHKIGSIGSPWWTRWLTWSDDRLRLIDISSMQPDRYWEKMASTLGSAALPDRQAVVFVHGYNISFEDAALRAAQIGFDLSIKHAMAFFSWPSRGDLEAYPSDEATIEASEQAITDFILGVAERSGADRVHIIAHSMGNRGVLRAINRIAAGASRRSGKIFGQFILAAADVDVDVFKQLCGAYTQLGQRTTLYISARDNAVEASRWLHGFARAGLMPPVLVAPGIDTINVTNVDLSILGHGYVAAAREVLQDMYHLIRQDLSPEMRFGLRGAVTAMGERYWEIGA